MRSPRRVWAIDLSSLWALSQVHVGMAQDSLARRRVLIGFTRAAGPDVRAEAVHGAGGEVSHSYHLLPVVSATLTAEVIEERMTRRLIAAWRRGQTVLPSTDEGKIRIVHN